MLDMQDAKVHQGVKRSGRENLLLREMQGRRNPQEQDRPSPQGALKGGDESGNPIFL